jgi:transposase
VEPDGRVQSYFAGLVAEGGLPDQLMVDAAHLKAHRTAANLRKRGAASHRIGRTKGSPNSKLHAVCDEHGRPPVMLLSQGQMSDYKGAALMLDAMPDAPVLIADRGCDADWLRQALRVRGIRPCIPGRAGRSRLIRHGKQLYRRRHKIEIMSGRLKDWRRIHTRYDRCAHAFMSAVTLAAIVLFWLPRCES